MKRWLLPLLASLALCSGISAEDGASSGNIRKIGPEESKALLNEVGLVLREKPPYPDTAYRLYPKPYVVLELATVGDHPFEPSEFDDRNPDDEKTWGPDGEPVVILLRPGVGMWMEGFFSRKRAPVEPTRYAYRYSKIPNNQEDPGETVAVMNFDAPKDEAGPSLSLFSEDNRAKPAGVPGDRELTAVVLSWFINASEKDKSVDELFKEIDSFPYPLGKRIVVGKGNWYAWCEPLTGFIGRWAKEPSTRLEENKLLWGKYVMRYYLPEETPHFPPLKMNCPIRKWLIEGVGSHKLHDGTVLVSVGENAVIRLRWEDGEPVGPLPPFIKVIDARDVIWAKLDLLRRYRDEMRARGLTDATKLRTPTQIMHDLAAYFFDIREIRNWKKGGDK